MKRDLDFLRELLLFIEKKGTLDDILDWPELFQKGYKDEKVHLHLLLLSDAGYIQLDVTEGDYNTEYDPRRITMSGYDYLDSVRDLKVWRDTKRGLIAVGGTASLAIVQAIAVAIIKNSLTKAGINIT